MKIKLLGILILLSFISGCSLASSSSNKTALTFSFPVSSKTSSKTTSTATPTEARLWLYSGKQLLASGAKAYYSTAISGSTGSITVNSIATGTNYSVVVATGVTSNNVFLPLYYGVSKTFSVNSGVESSVSISLTDLTVNLAEALQNTEVNGALDLKASSENFYAATSSTLYSLDPTTLALNTSLSIPNGSVSSLSQGTDSSSLPFLLVNTDKGIYQLDSGTLTIVGSNNNNNAATWSGAVSDTYFFMGNTSLGGFVSDSDTAWKTASWNTIAIDSIDGLNGNPVLDLAAVAVSDSKVYGFFATNLVGTFRVDSDFFNQTNTDFTVSGILSNANSSNSYFQFVGGSIPLVKALSLYKETDSTYTLYLGTKGGIYELKEATTSSKNFSNPVLLSNTQGLDISKLLINSDGLGAFIAGNDIYLLHSDGTLIRLPFFTEPVGTLKRFCWGQNDILYIYGTAGLLRVDASVF